MVKASMRMRSRSRDAKRCMRHLITSLLRSDGYTSVSHSKSSHRRSSPCRRQAIGEDIRLHRHDHTRQLSRCDAAHQMLRSTHTRVDETPRSRSIRPARSRPPSDPIPACCALGRSARCRRLGQLATNCRTRPERHFLRRCTRLQKRLLRGLTSAETLRAQSHGGQQN